ncbi:MAG: transposase [Deltaproteobacteria bacterium]|nr:transposase [Deltaproteobacteria bacterium]MBI3387339.1 transposase [Deltaproteobacteria bacterium]
MNVLSLEQQALVIGALTEGCGIRTVERLTEIHRDTVMRLGVRIGEACRNLHDAMMRDLQVNTIELDEQWAFIGKKQKQVKNGDAPELGDVWLFVALAANQKAVISYRVGKRTSENTRHLVNDLRFRILNRPQITADGYAPYIGAIDRAFGVDVDFAILEKQYQAPIAADAAHRYSPSSIRAVEKTVIRGNPDEDKISTSYVERFNLTTRMQMRRFTRLTNGFSKTLRNHSAAISLQVAFYNLCRVHETLRCTPAMALGVTNHIWTIGELIEAATSAPVAPENPPPPPTTMRPGYRPVQLRVIPGGRMS